MMTPDSTAGNPADPRPHSPWTQLAADAVLWLKLVLLFLVFRGALLWIFRAKLSPDAGSEAFRRCFETGARFDLCVATHFLLPSLLLTVVGFAGSLGQWH